MFIILINEDHLYINCIQLSVLLILGIALPGCELQGGAPPVSSSLEEATVKGIVRFHGKVIDNGNIIFHCANIKRPNAGVRETSIGKDGAYSVRTLVGGNTVELQCRELRDPKTRRPVPYELHFDVESGENTLDINIDKKLARSNR
jgi:hypothetical protein